MTDAGWYFYGITRRGSLSTLLALADTVGHVDASRESTPLQLLEFSELAAVVRSVRMDDFSATALEERLQSETALEGMVRSHNGVIEAIHARQAMLPAKLGAVHARQEEMLSALRREHDSLLRQLNWLEGRDEWALHLYADGAGVAERISKEDPAIRRLREAHALARPGRAYFLEQQIREALESTTELQLSTLGQATFDRLAPFAVERQSSDVQAVTDQGEIEILRASFLVSRTNADAFTREARCIGDSNEHLRCDVSGPWPPYSFAVWHEETR